MLSFFIISVVFGVLLGLRFRVLVLIPATLLMTVAVGLVGIANAQAFWTVALTTVVIIGSLQCGYIVGCIMQMFYFSTRVPTRPAVHFRRAGYGTE
jgi:hypothetical protein